MSMKTVTLLSEKPITLQYKFITVIGSNKGCRIEFGRSCTEAEVKKSFEELFGVNTFDIIKSKSKIVDGFYTFSAETFIPILLRAQKELKEKTRADDVVVLRNIVKGMYKYV